MGNEPINNWRAGVSKLGAMWCELRHESPMWPIHGRYQCRSCGRTYPVDWTSPPAPVSIPAVQMGPVSFRSAVLPLLVVMAIVLVPHASAAVDMDERAAASFARYIAGLPQAKPWSLETIDIDASLPRLSEKGRMRAVRYLMPFGKPRYEVLEFAGTQTVKDQVIIRYLSADAKSADIPASSLAITPANYKFTYEGTVTIAGVTTYSFAIKPRKKRVGLIKGELYLDGETGGVVRETGYLVKSPSVFIKRITLTRENFVRDGRQEERITHLSIDTRLIGQAELVIHERPCSDPDDASAAAFWTARR